MYRFGYNAHIMKSFMCSLEMFWADSCAFLRISHEIIRGIIKGIDPRGLATNSQYL